MIYYLLQRLASCPRHTESHITPTRPTPVMGSTPIIAVRCAPLRPPVNTSSRDTTAREMGGGHRSSFCPNQGAAHVSVEIPHHSGEIHKKKFNFPALPTKVTFDRLCGSQGLDSQSGRY